MAEGTDEFRKVAEAIVKDLSKMVDKHGPKVRKAAKDVVDKDFPKVVAAMKKELPEIQRSLEAELRKLRKRSK